MASASDVPSKYDCVVNGEGYVIYDAFQNDANLPQKATHSFSPAFVPRQNIEGNYGDDKQEFWLVYSQRDWSLGQGQKYQDRQGERRRYWKGSHVDVLVPGEAKLRRGAENLAFSSAPESMCYMASQTAIAIGGATNLFTIVADGTITDEGAHGLGNSPARWGMCSDGTNLYMTTEATSTVGVRKWTGSAFSTFSSVGSSACAYLNNTLFGLDQSGILRRYSTAGAASTIHTWQQADGTAITLGTKPRMVAFGGKLLVLLDTGLQTPELWLYDGVGVSILSRFSSNFTAHGLEVLNGVAFVSGFLTQSSGSYKAVIYYYASGNIGKLWEAEQFSALGVGSPDLASFDEKLVFNDSAEGKIMIYAPEGGGISSLGSYTPSDNQDSMIAAADSFLVATNGGGSGFQEPALVQSGAAVFSGSLSSPKTVSWPSPTTPGNTLLLAVQTQEAGGVPAVTTPSGWTLVGTDNVGINSVYLFKIVGSASRSGAQSVAWTSGTAVSLVLQLFEYSGTGIEDVTAASDSGVSASPNTGTTLTTTQNDELWFALVGWSGESPFEISAPTNDFALVRWDGTLTAGTAAQLAAYSKTVSATGTASMGATLSESRNWTALVATFKAKAVGEGQLLPSDTTATGGFITHSLIDYDSSLEKMFRGITVDFDEDIDGDGGSVDIAYRLSDAEGEYTDLQADAVSGTEYVLVGVNGRSLSVKVTLNKGSSTNGPTLKRVYVRAVPKVNTFHRARFILNCTGKDGESPVVLRDSSLETRDGQDMVDDLHMAVEAESPFDVTDKFGTRTSIVEAAEFIEIRPNEYVADVTVREV